MQSPELLNRIAEWRRKSADGSITLDEMKEAIIVLRESRRTAVTNQKKPKSKRGGPARSAEDLLSELDKL